MPKITPPLSIASEIEDALSEFHLERKPVIALESAVISHGLPFPDNLDVIAQMKAAIRESHAIPAVVAVANGKIVVGADDDLVQELARAESVEKVNLSNMGIVLAGGGFGATTVAATLWAAHQVGIDVFVTGGIGGRHRPTPFTEHDVSNDLIALSRYPVLTVCAGAKSILDIPGTRETLETFGVPLIGYGCETLPLFFSPPGNVVLDTRVDAPAEVARIARMHWAMGGAGIVTCVPCPQEMAVEASIIEGHIAALEKDMPEEVANNGRLATPWMLRRLDELTDGASRAANIALLVNNARIGGSIAISIHDYRHSEDMVVDNTASL